MVSEEERAAAELKRINAEARKLAAGRTSWKQRSSGFDEASSGTVGP